MRIVYMPVINSTIDTKSIVKDTWEEIKNKNKPKDWKFMQDCEKTLKEMPDTWKKYQDNETGSMSIIDMEYGELKRAMNKEDMKHELIHVASACLRLWRKLEHVE